MRSYGSGPVRAVLLHGGPGARGEMAAVCRLLATRYPGRFLEVLQEGESFSALLAQLEDLPGLSSRPMLLGYSFGAWLAWLEACRRPHLWRSVVLVGSGPLSVEYVPKISAARRASLGEEDWRRYQQALSRAKSLPGSERAKPWEELGRLSHRSDLVSPKAEWLAELERDLDLAGETAQALMQEASELRRLGSFLRPPPKDLPPVRVLHGSKDPHPWEGVIEPLRELGVEPALTLLENCGHTPWVESQGREPFLKALGEWLAKGEGERR